MKTQTTYLCILISPVVRHGCSVLISLIRLRKQEKTQKKKESQQSSDDDDDEDVQQRSLYEFFSKKTPPKRTSRKKRQHEIRQLMKQAKALIATFPRPEEEKNNTTIVGGGKKKKKTDAIVGGAQPKPKENPLKKELANPAGLDFANQMGAILAQPTQINMVPLVTKVDEQFSPKRLPLALSLKQKKSWKQKATFATLTCKDVKVLLLPAKEHFITFDFMVPMFTFPLSSLLPPLPVPVVAMAINNTTFRPTLTFWQPILPMVPSLFPIDLLTFSSKKQPSSSKVV